MSLTEEGDKVCRKKLHTLFLLCLLVLLCSVPMTCSAMEVSREQLTQLEMIMSEQENLLIQLQAKLAESQTNSETLATDLEAQQKQVTILQQRLVIANQSLVVASNLIDRQNQSLTTLSKEIKQERRQAKIDKYKYAVYGIIAGLLYGGIK